MAASEVGTGSVVVVVAAVVVVVVVVESGMASIVGAALAGAGGVASAGVVLEEGGSGVGAVVAKGGVGALTVVVVSVVSVVAVSVAGSGITEGLTLSTGGSVAGSFSGGGVGSEGCEGAFGSSDASEGAARRLLKDARKAEAVELDWGTEKASLVFDSGGLNRLPDTAPLDKSAPVESSEDFRRSALKLNCAAPLPIPSPESPKVNEAAVGLAEESLASSP